MSQTITVANFPDKNIIERSVLSTDALSGDTIIYPENTQNITLGSWVILGQLGAELSELVTVAGPITGPTELTVSPLVYAHYLYDPVTVIFGDKLVIYRATNVDGKPPADAAFTELTVVDLDVDQLTTTYIDAGGGSDYWYKLTYKDSSDDTETSLSSSRAVRGGGVGDYATIEAIRHEAGFDQNKNVTDVMIDEKRQAAQSIINSRLGTRYTVPFQPPINDYVADLTTRLAAGYLLLQQYGAYTQLDTNNGQSKIDKVMAELKELQEGTATLVGEDGGSEVGGSNSGFEGWPNATTVTAAPESAGGDHMFRVSDAGGRGKY